jgi:type II secretory pathway pseudopilin PulG
MREKPIGVVLTILAVLAVGAAPAAFVAFDGATAARPERAAVSTKVHRSQETQRRR